MSETVLITGADGFIGSHLVESQLWQGRRVRALDAHNHYLASVNGKPNLEILQGDIRDLELVERALAGVDAVYHLASAHLDVNLNERHYQEVNQHASLALARAAYQAGVRRFVHCSSVGVIGDVRVPPADEWTACHPTNIYEQTKLEGERAVLAFACETGFELVVARPAWVYGPRCPRTARLFRTVSKGRFFFFGKGDNLRHPIFIADAVRGLERCAEAEGVAGQIFILAGEKPVTTRELVGGIARTVGVRPPSLRLPAFLGNWAGLGVETLFKPLRRRPPFSSRSMDFFVKNNAFDITKAVRELGFAPETGLEQGLALTANTYWCLR